MRKLALTFCLASTLFYSVKLYADFCARAGDYLVERGDPVRGMDSSLLAVKLAPESIRYRTMYINNATYLCGLHPSQEARALVVGEMLRVAMVGVRRMPDDSDSHYVLGFAARNAFRITGREKYRTLALSEVDKALGLAPYFEPLRELRKELQ
jgi:hypothetical protein